MLGCLLSQTVWCIECEGQGHDKDTYPVFVNYLVGGGLMPLRSEAQAGPRTTLALWCAIFHIGGKHTTDNFHRFQKYTQTSQQYFCNFCGSVGHDEHTYKSYELMMGWNSAYRVKTEMQALDPNAGMARA